MQTHKYIESSKMIDMINEDGRLLSTTSRFGISFGFGNQSIAQACAANGIDTKTFLAVVNFIAEENFDISTQTIENLSVETVINYLKNAHNYFLGYKLPSIRNKLHEAITSSNQSEAYKWVLIRFFDDYVLEVRKHMDYEDKTLFPYVSLLIKGHKEKNYNVQIFEEHHTEVDSKLAELKNILIKYYPSEGNNYLLNEVIYDLLACEKDLITHNNVEDYFFVPIVEAIEKKLTEK